MLTVTLAFCCAAALAHLNHSSSANNNNHAHPQKLDSSYDHCPISRNDALECARKFCDADNDGRLSPCEIRSMKDDVLNLAEQFLVWFYSMKKIMEDCDYDRDGFITKTDLEHNAHTCMIDCKSAMLFDYAVCQPAKEMNYKPKHLAGCKWDNKLKDFV